MSEKQVRLIYLGIGSNLGNKKKNIERTKFLLIQNDIKILEVSKLYESLSWPNPNNPKFLNVVLSINTSYSPKNLLKICKKIEKKLGRKKSAKNAPRICDIDIIDFKMKLSNDRIVLPHSKMHKRNFVLIPLFDLNKDWIHPKSKDHIKSLILSLSNSDIRSIKQI